MQVYAKTDVGQVRAMNQDSFYCSMTPVGVFPNLFIVADGMGGHKGGEYASRYAIESFIDYVSHSDEKNLIRLMDQGIKEANRRVVEASNNDENLSGMGTTFVAAYVENQQLYAANVGDSRLYLIGHEINQVTEDHSYVAAMVRAGEITEEEARCHPEKNIITRAIGVSKDVKPDFFEVDLKPDDRILICSDGLSNMIEQEMIFNIVKSGTSEEALNRLVDEANNNGGLDNITVIVLEPEVQEVNE